MTSAHGLITALFDERLSDLALSNGLSDAEKARIRTVFLKALANPFMDDAQIHINLIDAEKGAQDLG